MTKYKKAIVYVTDNGYTIVFSEYQGQPDSKQGFKIATSLDQVQKILKANFKELVD